MTETSTRPQTAVDDVVDLLIGQHMLIRDLFTEVEAATGDARQDAFERLVRLLAVHETAEEEVVHPLARQLLDGGDELVDERLTEEHDAKEVLSRLEDIGPDGDGFLPLLAEFRESVLAHAAREEAYEFRYLRRSADPATLKGMAVAVRAAEATAPTHPHPGVESATANLLTGPVVAVFDRARDLMRKAMSDNGSDGGSGSGSGRG
jgi:hemerythrin superfamily protein